jgi:hypothetical protein
MAHGITLEQAQAKLAEYIAAETAVLSNQEYTIDNRRLKRADLEMIQLGIKAWDGRCKELGAKQDNRRRVLTGRPR